MSFLSTAPVLLAIFFAWGAGLSLLVLPRRWRRHWPVFAPFAGTTLLAATVWAGVWLDVRGTDRYAALAWAVPALLLAVAWRRKNSGGWRGALADLRRHGGVLALAVAVAVLAARPLDRAGVGLTAVSLGSCDAADYAAGARVLKEFARTDREGFLGHEETVRLRSVDNFPDHWLRLNHFTPSALLAWTASALDFRLHKLVTVLGVALLAAGVPLAFWAARALVCLGPWASLCVAAAWGVGAVNLYAVAQVALGQLLCAPALVVLTWAGVQTWRDGARGWGGVRWMPLLVVAVSAILAAYHFAIVFGAAPLVAWLALATRRRAGYARLARTAVLGLGALALGGGFWAARVAGLAERFALFDEYDFGWFIPVFSVERWFGWFGDAALEAGPGALVVTLGFGGAWLAWAWFGRGRARTWQTAVLLVPVVLGYGWLAHQGLEERSNKVYDAYKLFAVFQPLTLAVLAAPLAWATHRRAPLRWAGAVLGLALVLVHAGGGALLRAAMARPALVVDKPIAELKRAEGFADVGAVNLILEPMWARLWANGFLLRKPQHFAVYTYEGRRPTPLRGEWDLRDRLVTVLTGDDDCRLLSDAFYLLRRTGPRFLDVSLAGGWHALERDGGTQWSWNAGTGALRVVNPHATPRRATLEFRVRSVVPRKVLLARAGAAEPLWSAALGTEALAASVVDVEFPPGETMLELRSPEPPATPPGDSRALGVALYNFVVRVAAPPSAATAPGAETKP